MQAFVAVFIYCALVAAGWYPRQNAGHFSIDKTIPQKVFTSCDRQRGLKILSDSECMVVHNGLTTKARYTMLKDNLHDLFRALGGHMSRSELWYQPHAEGFMDRDGVVLYDLHAPELETVKKMWWYAGFAQKMYAPSKRYPTDGEKCKFETGYVFINQYSQTKDYAPIIFEKHSSADPTKTTPAKVGAPHWRPGAIYCVCSDYKSFFVHGFDRDGLPLTASPDQYFVIESHAGITLTKHQDNLSIANLGKANPNAPQLSVYVSADDLVKDKVMWLRKVIPAGLWIVGLLCLVLTFQLRNLPQYASIKVFNTACAGAAFVLLLAWYAYAMF